MDLDFRMENEKVGDYWCVTDSDGKVVSLSSWRGAPLIGYEQRKKRYFSTKKEAVQYLCNFSKKSQKNFFKNWRSQFQTTESFMDAIIKLRVVRIIETISEEENMVFHLAKLSNR